MLTLHYFAIRHKPTGHFLPSRKANRGFSHDIPVPRGGKDGPRLFKQRNGASLALHAWVKGIWKREYTRPSIFGDEADEFVLILPQPERKMEDMEIVAFRLVELPPK